MDIEFRRLPEVPIGDLVDLFNDPEVRRHVPLAKTTFTTDICSRLVTSKERMWAEHGYGPWAFFVGGEFAGWGGLQPEGPDADLGFVLHPRFRGIGIRLAREVLRRAFEEMDQDSVIVLLPPSRTRVRGLKRMGFEPDGEALVGGEPFVRYRCRNPRHVLRGQNPESRYVTNPAAQPLSNQG